MEEANLAQNVSLLRKALGEPHNGRLYIETIPKRGYRFTANVREISGERAADAREAMTHSTLTEIIEDESSGVAIAKTNGKRPLNGNAQADGSNGTSAAASSSISPSTRTAQPLAAVRAESSAATVADAAALPLGFEFSALPRRGFDRHSSRVRPDVTSDPGTPRQGANRASSGARVAASPSTKRITTFASR